MLFKQPCQALLSQMQSMRPSARAFSVSSTVCARKKPQTHPPLPVPNAQKPPSRTSDSHPLWQFFRPDRQSLTSPVEDAKHGRSWTAQELRRKSFDDLHALWIVCLKERNILATQRHERRRQQMPTAGAAQAGKRDWTVRRTMAGIKFVLNERFIGWSEAVELAKAEGLIEVPAEADAASAASQETVAAPSEVPGEMLHETPSTASQKDRITA